MMETTQEERERYNQYHVHGTGDCFPCALMRDVDMLEAALEPILAYYDDGVGSADTMREEHLPKARAVLAPKP